MLFGYDGYTMRATYAYIYLDNLRHNLAAIRTCIKPETRICVPVKADAYGHGAVQTARTAQECGVSYLAVAAVSEGIELREAGIELPILLLSVPQPEEFAEIVSYALMPAVFDAEFIDLLSETAVRMKRRLPVHLKIDTGMGRIGCPAEEAARLAERISKSAALELAGVFTHFAAADSLVPADEAYTHGQIERFVQAVDSIRDRHINPGIVHCASSAAILQYPEAQFDMVRPGIIVYGYYPGDITEDYLQRAGRPLHLKPLLEVRSKISAIKPIRAGESISYGRTWTADSDGEIGVIPIGYADGIIRRFAPDIRISVNGRAYPVRGRICMDQCMIDLGKNSGVSRWDDAIIFGPKENGAACSAEDLAQATGTISYEILCGINKRVPRVYIP
ncbi:Alanine racemase [Treponema brennaborense DSM 12168]|uniref:Alanine racemase n=2 Tax=Treponema TaxID=157 RepID=F4LMM4_TREBD|nr:Alanine racemase [Treponema brennaborense DSM 12168]